MATARLPTGVVTFLFTDIQGSTRLLARLGRAYAALLSEHHRILREAISEGAGVEVKTEGDSFFVVFTDASAGVRAAVTAQRALAATDWPEGSTVTVRMGLHEGEVELNDGEYIGMELHRAARIASVAHGGQIVISDRVRDAVLDAMPAGVEALDLGDHRLRDIDSPIHLYQLSIDGLRSEFPPVTSLSARFESLPPELSAFVGRDRQVANVSDLLGDSRLLTMTGPGGTGKSRLALQVARHCSASYRHGVAFVPLAPIEDASLVAPTIRSTLGFAEEPGKPPLETLVEQLREQELLLVLDNFEQVLPAAATVSELMAGTVNLTVLVTSRAALHLDGEQEFAVPPLEVPDASATLDAASVADNESVRLFVDRASKARPDFHLDDSNAVAVAAICQRLEGLPLAIELAASRVKLLDPEALLGRLNRRLDGLGVRHTGDRRRTLRGTIDWSHDLLEPQEQAALRRLAVFSGGATLEAIEAVLPGEAADDAVGPDPLEPLAALVDNSLVRRIDSKGGTRYGMLETIREYGLERLEAAAERDAVEARHAAWFLELVGELAPGFTSGPDGLDRVEADHDNVRNVMQRLIDARDTQAAFAAVGDLWRFWHLRGHLREGLDVCGTVMALPDADARTSAAAAALYAHASLLYWQSDSEAALTSYLRSLEVARAAGATAREAEAQFALSYTYMITKQWDEAHAAAVAARELYGDLDDELGVSNSRYADAYARALSGNYAAAVDDFRAILRDLEGSGDRFWLMNSRVTLAWTLSRVGELAEADRIFEENLEDALEMGDASMQGMVIDGFATTAALRGDYERAMLLAGAAAAIADKLGGKAPDELVVALDPVAITRDGHVSEGEIDRLMAEGRRLDPAAVRELALSVPLD